MGFMIHEIPPSSNTLSKNHTRCNYITNLKRVNVLLFTNNNASKTGILSQKLSYIIAGLLENSTYGLNAIKTAINTISTNTSNGSIRKIIRGTFSFTATSQAISISLTNYNKAVVILNGNTIGTSGNIQDIYVGGLTNTTLTLKTMSVLGESKASYGGYQIIEYY